MMLKVTRGDPTPEELAALLAVLFTNAAPLESAPIDSDTRLSLWRRSGLPFQPHRLGQGAWAASARTR